MQEKSAHRTHGTGAGAWDNKMHGKRREAALGPSTTKHKFAGHVHNRRVTARHATHRSLPRDRPMLVRVGQSRGYRHKTHTHMQSLCD